MTQYYVNPQDVEIDPALGRVYAGRRLRAIIDRDGQIVPVLVHREVIGDDVLFTVSDRMQAERVDAFRIAGWPTILVEDEWTEDDL
jgi:hypothetical protein